jgi:adenylate kinase family enzyme
MFASDVKSSTSLPMPGRKIIVVGTSGSGKTHTAKAIAARLGIKYICNDSLIWRANWQLVPKSERRPAFAAATDCDAWVIDGNVTTTTSPENALLLERCDTIVWLDLPRRTVWSRVILRTIKRVFTGEELWHGNRETFRNCFLSRDSIILWSIQTFPKYRAKYADIFADEQWKHVKRIQLKNKRQVKNWLDDLNGDSID